MDWLRIYNPSHGPLVWAPKLESVYVFIYIQYIPDGNFCLIEVPTVPWISAGLRLRNLKLSYHNMDIQ